jgi:hypothetical protein
MQCVVHTALTNVDYATAQVIRRSAAQPVTDAPGQDVPYWQVANVGAGAGRQGASVQEEHWPDLARTPIPPGQWTIVPRAVRPPACSA